MSQSLQPPNATDLERAISAVTGPLNIDVPINALWDADACPAHALSWLAWAVSVDNWDPAWTEPQKRTAIKRSIFVHRHKGTRAAINAALCAVDYTVDLVEWWQESPPGPPCTFRADVEITGRGVDDGTQAQILRLIDSSKNIRSHLVALRLVGRAASELRTASVVVSGEVTTVQPYMVAVAEVSGFGLMGSGLAVYDTTTVYPLGA